jgi:hypothetical protein
MIPIQETGEPDMDDYVCAPCSEGIQKTHS